MSLYSWFVENYNLISIGSTLTIPTVLLWGYGKLGKDKKENYIIRKSKVSLYTTFGVLGTFGGIYIGLQDFNPSNINDSIPVLLEGFKGSFSSSITGLFGSIVSPIILDFLNKELVLDSIKDISDLTLESNRKLDKLIKSNNEVKDVIINSMENISKNNIDVLVESLQEVMEKFDEKISSHFEGVVRDMLSQIEKVSEVVNENYSLYQTMSLNGEKIINSSKVISDNLLKVESSSDRICSSFKSLIEYYIRMEKNAANASSAFENINSLSYKAKEGISNLDQFFKEFSDRFNQIYTKEITKATEAQANHLIDITYTILKQINAEVA